MGECVWTPLLLSRPLFSHLLLPVSDISPLGCSLSLLSWEVMTPVCHGGDVGSCSLSKWKLNVLLLGAGRGFTELLGQDLLFFGVGWAQVCVTLQLLCPVGVQGEKGPWYQPGWCCCSGVILTEKHELAPLCCLQSYSCWAGWHWG